MLSHEHYLDFASFFSYERLILLTLSLMLFMTLLFSFKKIIRDRNKILDDLDKIIFFFSLLQAFVFCTSLIFSFVFFIICLRFLRFFQESLILSTLLYAQLNIQNWKLVKYGVIGVSLIFSLFWCLMVFLNDYQFDYRCDTFFFITIAGVTLITSTMSIYFGYNCINMLNYQIYNNEANSQNNNEELKNKKKQLIILLGGSFLTVFIQFFWDYFLQFKKTEEICIIYYHSQNFGQMLFLIILKGICYLAPLIVIYKVFFKMNEKFFNCAKETDERSLSVFQDFRSEFLDDDEEDDEQFGRK